MTPRLKLTTSVGTEVVATTEVVGGASVARPRKAEPNQPVNPEVTPMTCRIGKNKLHPRVTMAWNIRRLLLQSRPGLLRPIGLFIKGAGKIRGKPPADRNVPAIRLLTY